jgi:putative endonuclease
MTNLTNTVLYIGVTNDLNRRIVEHRDRTGSKFTSRYKITKLVYYDSFNNILDAIAAEKKIKAGSRANKIKLIVSINPNWKDLFEESIG